MTYQLHDYELDSVVLEEERIVFSFPKGFYIPDQDGQQAKPIRRRLVFSLGKDGCVFVRKTNKRRTKWKYISFEEFAALLKKGTFLVSDEYDSKLHGGKMIQLYGDANLELFIEGITNVACING